MTKQAAVALILVLPGLVMADFYRLRPSPNIAQPDVLPWSMQMRRPKPAAVHSVSSSWASITSPDPAGLCKSRAACPVVVPQHLGRCLSQPYCGPSVPVPVLWPHSPRTDERKTLTKEQRFGEGRVQDGQPVN
jgi:hypothetical protein